MSRTNLFDILIMEYLNNFELRCKQFVSFVYQRIKISNLTLHLHNIEFSGKNMLGVNYKIINIKFHRYIFDRGFDVR